ncbi:hypothetical protein FC72_GL001212 [Companilactobacillus tucceti DSM 20183]|uniref:HEPN/Toprim N-terminal domain-containing protein n=1 Tax=Companilactobacillus tucceti DSM 20183 TaxID=1423811 RepID=A0A0R1J6A0_9LACO|nr:HEPN/Toprim-associated domain-containing protein [Companilactobacillus tucceti]KRK63668.1 hypothetical protein FC72_GL001212 [Companilactobacillus tucceti DSM 20183]
MENENSYLFFSIGNFEIDFNKGYMSDENYCPLFTSSDKKLVKYIYDNNNYEMKMGYSKIGFDVKERLNMLGYTFQNTKKKYEEYINSYSNSIIDKIDFESLVKILYKINIKEKYNYSEDDNPQYLDHSEIPWDVSEKLNIFNINHYDEFLLNIDPLIILRILLEVKKNCNFFVTLRHLNKIYNINNDFYPKLKKNEKIYFITCDNPFMVVR